MSEIALRLARMGDAPRIAGLSRTLIEAGLPWSWTPRRVAAHMRAREHLTVIAVNGGELAGFALAQFGNRSVHVSLLGVAHEYQRHGLGRRLMTWVEETAGIAGLFLMQLEVRAGRASAAFLRVARLPGNEPHGQVLQRRGRCDQARTGSGGAEREVATIDVTVGDKESG